jgi:hypothetical protein
MQTPGRSETAPAQFVRFKRAGRDSAWTPGGPATAAGHRACWRPARAGARTALMAKSLSPGTTDGSAQMWLFCAAALQKTAAQTWELMFKDGDGGDVQVFADQAQVQVPAPRAAIGPLDPGRDDTRVAPRDDAPSRQPVQAGTYRPLRHPGIADQRGHRRDRARAVRPGVVGQADKHDLARWTAARPGRGPGPGSASTRSPRRSSGTISGPPARARPRNWAWSQMWSHSPASGTVQRRPRTAHPRRSRTVPNPGERRSAVLESVLGTSPREFESRILHQADLRRRAEQPRSSCLDTEICLSFCPRKEARRPHAA